MDKRSAEATALLKGQSLAAQVTRVKYGLYTVPSQCEPGTHWTVVERADGGLQRVPSWPGGPALRPQSSGRRAAATRGPRSRYRDVPIQRRRVQRRGRQPDRGARDSDGALGPPLPRRGEVMPETRR